ncbi:MAG: hypothetical protein LQ340_006763 [Diploschistes diacapsis]|nr:MAG: hypothetical protein LQ340_006763 [Diploschistes diacapsis]
MELRRGAGLCVLAFAANVLSQQPSGRPIPMTWNTQTAFGPDGPWQAVQVSVGTGSGKEMVSLYPGGSFDSDILTSKFCNNSCAAQAGGLYDPSQSPTADFTSIGASGSITSWSTDEAMNLTGQGVFTLDTMSVSSDSTAYPIPNTVFSSVVSTDARLPNGSLYSPVLGSLALGSPNPVQTFLTSNGSNVTGQLLTGYLADQGSIPSSSWGLHIGSASLNQVGSLVLGGYDQSRVVGEVGSIDTSGVGGEPIAGLVDASIGVEAGGSPFNTTTIPSLFQAGGNLTMKVMLNPLVPYMFLPFAMCEAIAQWLPVTYSPDTTLYHWNTDDYRYESIVKSPSYLSFTFQNGDTGNMTIKVPFALLNLTLESPLVATPTQYFPCKGWNSPDGTYFLGRAFLQAAYLGINWNQNKFFLAQAAGPGAQQPDVQIIKPTDNSLQSNPDAAFLQTWQSKWTVLPANASSSSRNSTAVPVSSSTSSGLSMGAQIGIGVGAGVAGLALIAGLIACLCIRSRRRKAEAQRQQLQPAETGATKTTIDDNKSDLEKHNVKHAYKNGYFPPQFRHEMEVPPSEMDAPQRIHEANGSSAIVHEAPSSSFAFEIDSREVDRRSPLSAGADSLPPFAGHGSRAASPPPGGPSPISPSRSPVSQGRGAKKSPVSPRRTPATPWQNNHRREFGDGTDMF